MKKATSPGPSRAALIAALSLLWLARPAAAEVIGTFTFQLTMDAFVPAFSSAGSSMTWDDVNYTLDSQTVNMAQLNGNQPLPLMGTRNQPTATYGNIEIASTGEPASFTLAMTGSYVCSPPTCVSSYLLPIGADPFPIKHLGNPISFVGNVTPQVGGVFGVGTTGTETFTFTMDGSATCAFPDENSPVEVCTGNGSLNAFRQVALPPSQPGCTDIGCEQGISYQSDFFNPITGRTENVYVEVTFARVDVGGDFKVTALSNQPSEIPLTYGLQVSGYSPSFYQISTDAVVQPPIQICLYYDDTNGLVTDTELPVSRLGILHGSDQDNTQFTDDTTNVDPASQRVCATSTHLSPFVLGAKNVGRVTSDRKAVSCEIATSGLAASLAKRVGKCLTDLAKAEYAGEPFDHAACLAAAKSKFDAASHNLKGCPACLQPAALASVRDRVVDRIEFQLARFFSIRTSHAYLSEAPQLPGYTPATASDLKCESSRALSVATHYPKDALKCAANTMKAALRGDPADQQSICRRDADRKSLNGATHGGTLACELPFIGGDLETDIIREVNELRGAIFCDGSTEIPQGMPAF